MITRARLVGKNCTLSAMKAAYLPDHVAFLNDPEVHRYLHIRPPFTIDQQRDWLRRSKASDTDYVFAVLAPTEGQSRFVGVMGLHDINIQDKTARTGMIIGNKNVWGRGIATEAKHLKLKFAFKTLQLRLITSAVAEENGASRRCLEKCGYRIVGRRLRFSESGETLGCEVLYEISSDSYLDKTRPPA